MVTNCSRQTPREMLRSTTASVVGRCVTYRARALVIIVGLGLLGVGASGSNGRSTSLVFRVEGSKDDPEFGRACGLVKGLEDLYGKERYRLQAINQEQPRRPPNKIWGWTLPLPLWLCHRGREASSEQVEHPAVVCSITQTSPVVDPENGGIEHVPGTFGRGESGESVPIGGVEDLMEFVRTSVLAGPRHFSFAYHERSLRWLPCTMYHRVLTGTCLVS